MTLYLEGFLFKTKIDLIKNCGYYLNVNMQFKL